MKKQARKLWVAGVMVTSVALGAGFYAVKSVQRTAHGSLQPHRARTGVTITELPDTSPPLVQSINFVQPMNSGGESGFSLDTPPVQSTAFLWTPTRHGRVCEVKLRNPGVVIARARKNWVTHGEHGIRRDHGQTRAVLSATDPARVSLPQGDLRSRRRDIDRCVGKGMVPGGTVPAPSGKLGVLWVVRRDGTADNVQVRENTLDDKQLAHCIVGAVRRWRFSPPVQGDTPMQSTFAFL